MKMQSNPLPHELSTDIRKCGVPEALKQYAPPCYTVSSQRGHAGSPWSLVGTLDEV
jgi:hypothetical protein